MDTLRGSFAPSLGALREASEHKRTTFKCIHSGSKILSKNQGTPSLNSCLLDMLCNRRTAEVKYQSEAKPNLKSLGSSCRPLRSKRGVVSKHTHPLSQRLQ